MTHTVSVLVKGHMGDVDDPELQMREWLAANNMYYSGSHEAMLGRFADSRWCYWHVTFRDSNHALMFKLAWG